MILNYVKSVITKTNKFILNGPSFYSSYSNKSLNCGDIKNELCDQKVVLYGWLHNIRLGGNILLLRDHSGIIQLISNNKDIADKKLSIESVIKVEGYIKRRPEKQINKAMKTGEFEVLIDKLEIINEASNSLPFLIKDHHKSTELHRMKYRYLDLRREEIQSVLRLRSNFEFSLCEFLIKMNNFVNVGTPSLFKSTPGGAREFVVPTREIGMYYSLIQSPQQHKQLLMVGGLERYMQLARCYRNEMSRPDRQPEFTQLDIEMSFVERQHLQALVEDMLSYSLRTIVPDLVTPFPVMSYGEAMRLYGSDRPNMRFGMRIEIFDMSGDQFLGVRVTRDLFDCLDRGGIDHFLVENCVGTKVEIVDCSKTRIFLKDSKENAVTNEFAFIIKNTDDLNNFKTMGDIRLFIANQLLARGKLVYSSKFLFTWIDRFPLFEVEHGILQPVHHQFTSPIQEHLDLLYSDPEQVIGEQFDLVCNGIEIGGGSIRIHNPDLQEYVIKDILKMDISLFSHLLEALRSGAPPHGGFALGNDRLLAVLTGSKTIRDVIAFPKTADGKDLMSGAPNELSEDQCEYYHLPSVKKELKKELLD